MSKNPMLKWVFVSEDWPQSITAIAADDLKNIRRDKLQAASDIFKVMQSRMDGYRQAAGAVFIGVLAAVLAFDSAFVRLLVEPSFWSPGNQKPDHRLVALIVACGVLLLVVTIVGSLVIRWLGQYFAEMTSIIYKIDLANQVFVPDAWLPGVTLYPHKFITTDKVDRCQEDQELVGWWDPAIRWFFWITFGITIINFLFYAFLTWFAWPHTSSPVPVTNLSGPANLAPNAAPSSVPDSTLGEGGATHD
jgi:hypothetical protein